MEVGGSIKVKRGLAEVDAKIKDVKKWCEGNCCNKAENITVSLSLPSSG
jgi:hypothetical protein